MASHKTLKSVVRSMVDSFTSLMNYSGDDYVMEMLPKAVKKPGSEIVSGVADKVFYPAGEFHQI